VLSCATVRLFCPATPHAMSAQTSFRFNLSILQLCALWLLGSYRSTSSLTVERASLTLVNFVLSYSPIPTANPASVRLSLAPIVNHLELTFAVLSCSRPATRSLSRPTLSLSLFCDSRQRMASPGCFSLHGLSLGRTVSLLPSVIPSLFVLRLSVITTCS
jgi:hypothetical protein